MLVYNSFIKKNEWKSQYIIKNLKDFYDNYNKKINIFDFNYKKNESKKKN